MKQKSRKEYYNLKTSKKYWDLFTLLNPKCRNVYDRAINYYLYLDKESKGVPKPTGKYSYIDNRYILEQFYLCVFRDKLNPLTIFRAFVRGYIAEDKDLRVFIDKVKKEIKIQDDMVRAQEEGEEKEKEKREQIIDQFALGKKEIENVFDIIAAGYDELRRK